MVMMLGGKAHQSGSSTSSAAPSLSRAKYAILGGDVEHGELPASSWPWAKASDARTKVVQQARWRSIAAGLLGLAGLVYFIHSTYFSKAWIAMPEVALVANVDWRDPAAVKRVGHRFLDQEQCAAMFSPLYKEADRARDFWRDQGGITFEQVDQASAIANARLLIYDNQLYVKGFVNGLFSRAYAQVALINEAVMSAPEPLPNVEFAISINDWPHPEQVPIWELSRLSGTEQVWLMPDYGFYSWPEPGVGSMLEVEQKTREREQVAHPRWGDKEKKLFWKGAFWVSPLREALKRAAEGKSWAGIEDMDWGNNAKENRKTIDGHCAYRYLAHVEGGSYSGRLKYIQMCRSVIVMHELNYIQHFHHLMDSNSSSPDQNTVVVPGLEWATLDATMDTLLADQGLSERIATNNYHFWRYWNSPAGLNCYVRRMIHNYAQVQKFKPVLGYEDASYNSFDLMREASWVIH